MSRHLLVAVVISFAAISPVRACSCVVSGSESEQVMRSYAAADHVFSANVVEDERGTAPAGTAVRTVKLHVLQVWKGSLAPGRVVTAIADNDYPFIGCGYGAPAESALLVYTAGPEPLALGACGRTAPLQDSVRDIPLLNTLSRKPEFWLGR